MTEAFNDAWGSEFEAEPQVVAKPCLALLWLAGRYYNCELTLDSTGIHKGKYHTNNTIKAVWYGYDRK